MVRSFLTAALVLLCTFASAQDRVSDESGVRQLMANWNAAYRSLDAKTLASLQTPEFELVNRLGQWTPQGSVAEGERMWAWTFTNIYKGKPGPEHTVERVRFVRPDVAIVQARKYWADVLTLDDGTRIPPHGEVDTFEAVKNSGAWKVAALNIHNQMPPFDVKPGESLEVPIPPK